MSSQHTKQLNRKLAELPQPFVRPSKNGYWVCPECATINHTVVTVIPNVDGESKAYVVPERVGCRSVFCNGAFDTLQPM